MEGLRQHGAAIALPLTVVAGAVALTAACDGERSHPKVCYSVEIEGGELPLDALNRSLKEPAALDATEDDLREHYTGIVKTAGAVQKALNSERNKKYRWNAAMPGDTFGYCVLNRVVTLNGTPTPAPGTAK